MVNLPFIAQLLGCCILISFGPASALAQKNRKSKQLSLPELESKADEAESDYYQTCAMAKTEVLEGIDGFVKYVDTAPGFAVDIRYSAKEELREAKNAFESQNRFTAIPALQGVYQRFAKTINPKYYAALDGLEKLRTAVPSGDARLAVIENRVTKLSDHYTAYDSLKAKSTWNGYRCDFQMPPHLEVNPAKIGKPGMFRVVQNTPASIEFSLWIEKRAGRAFEGVITQGGGKFKAKVQGEYDGLNLQMKMVQVIKGAHRDFQYAGTLVGGSALLGMQGFTTKKQFTQGAIFMTLK